MLSHEVKHIMANSATNRESESGALGGNVAQHIIILFTYKGDQNIISLITFTAGYKYVGPYN